MMGRTKIVWNWEQVVVTGWRVRIRAVFFLGGGALELLGSSGILVCYKEHQQRSETGHGLDIVLWARKHASSQQQTVVFIPLPSSTCCAVVIFYCTIIISFCTIVIFFCTIIIFLLFLPGPVHSARCPYIRFFHWEGRVGWQLCRCSTVLREVNFRPCHLKMGTWHICQETAFEIEETCARKGTQNDTMHVDVRCMNIKRVWT